MKNIAREECHLAKRLPPEGVVFGEVHIDALHCDCAQEGIVLAVSLDSNRTICHLWLAGTVWKTWCEAQLGTADVTSIDAVLLTEILEWGVQPWLTSFGATIVQCHSMLSPCSLLPGYLSITFNWQVERHPFQALLLGDSGAYLDVITARIPSQARPAVALPPLACALYIGWGRLSLGDLQALDIGAGLRVKTFGNPLAGEFALLVARRIGARITCLGDNKMHIDELVQDITSLLDDEQVLSPSDDRSPLALDTLPQILLVEVGHVDITLGALRAMSVGDILPAETVFSPAVTLRLNGRAVGQGELIRCGDDFLVRVCRWYPAEAKAESTISDGVNAR